MMIPQYLNIITKDDFTKSKKIYKSLDRLSKKYPNDINNVKEIIKTATLKEFRYNKDGIVVEVLGGFFKKFKYIFYYYDYELPQDEQVYCFGEIKL